MKFGTIDGVGKDPPMTHEDGRVELVDGVGDTVGGAFGLDLDTTVFGDGFHGDGAVVEQCVFAVLEADDSGHAAGVRRWRIESVSDDVDKEERERLTIALEPVLSFFKVAVLGAV